MANKENLPQILTRGELLEKIDTSRQQIPAVLQKRVGQVDSAVEEFLASDFLGGGNAKSLASLNISRLAFHPVMQTHGEVTYTEKEIYDMFEVFMAIATKLNNAFGFIPQIGHFTRFIDVSETRFKHWKNNGSAELQEACNKVFDDLSTTLGDAMLQKKVDPVSAIFLEKSRNDRRDNAEIPKQTIQAQNVIIADSEMLSLRKELGYK